MIFGQSLFLLLLFYTRALTLHVGNTFLLCSRCYENLRQRSMRLQYRYFKTSPPRFGWHLNVLSQRYQYTGTQKQSLQFTQGAYKILPCYGSRHVSSRVTRLLESSSAGSVNEAISPAIYGEDLYGMLQVASNASRGDIKASYKAIVSLNHPDRNNVSTHTNLVPLYTHTLK